MSAQLSFEFRPESIRRDAPAKDLVRKVLMDMLPPGSPPCFHAIAGARFQGPRRATAELEMFDGRSAEVEVWQWRPDSWAQKWNRLDGGDISLEDGAWKRYPTETEPKT